MSDLVLVTFIPVSSIFLLFLKDRNTDRKFLLNMIIIFNNILYFAPLVLAFTNTPEGESMWNENTGGGAWLWTYFLILPLCAIAHITLFIFKLSIHLKIRKPEETE